METSITSAGIFALMGLSLVFGLKHATEIDHVVAVSTVVSEHRNVWRAALVGALWGAGHTLSLVVVGVIVLVFRVAIPRSVASWLEFGVAVMIIGLGVLTVMRVLSRRSDVHRHRHTHDGASHIHIHFHEHGTGHPTPAHSQSSPPIHSHAISKLGLKPLVVGAMHGLAGSAALSLVVLTQVPTVSVGLVYLGVFGLGSTAGMMLMSAMIGLPFALSGQRLSGLSNGLQTAAGALSVAFGIWYAYHVGTS
jgi:ABC-type nickel/cobalt efflux system permease component RcnA